MRFKEYVEAMSESEAKKFLISYNKRCYRFERFLVSKLGKKEYIKLCLEFAKQELTDLLRNDSDQDSDREKVSESFWTEKGWYENEQ